VLSVSSYQYHYKSYQTSQSTSLLKRQFFVPLLWREKLAELDGETINTFTQHFGNVHIFVKQTKECNPNQTAVILKGSTMRVLEEVESAILTFLVEGKMPTFEQSMDIHNQELDLDSTWKLETDKDTILYFYNDMICINLRSFLVLFCNYYYSPYFSHIVVVSSISHLSFIYLSTVNILQLLTDDSTKHVFFQFHYIYNILSSGVDIFLFYLNSQNEIAVPYFLTNIAIILVFIIEPFNKLNHVLLHILLILQNYYMCLSNINNNYTNI
jgi:hypothetical protein